MNEDYDFDLEVRDLDFRVMMRRYRRFWAGAKNVQTSSLVCACVNKPEARTGLLKALSRIQRLPIPAGMENLPEVF